MRAGWKRLSPSLDRVISGRVVGWAGVGRWSITLVTPAVVSAAFSGLAATVRVTDLIVSAFAGLVGGFTGGG
jgi:hypothetical protein